MRVCIMLSNFLLVGSKRNTESFLDELEKESGSCNGIC